MLLIHPTIKPISSWTFTAEILILYHSTVSTHRQLLSQWDCPKEVSQHVACVLQSVQLNYQPVVHIGTVRQAARLTHMTGKRVLRTGERCHCHFQFMYRPEYIKPGSRLLFREGRTKGVSAHAIPTTDYYPWVSGSSVKNRPKIDLRWVYLYGRTGNAH